MANGFLVPFATGALTELQRQKQVSDDIAASVVDTVSQHVLGVEIPKEKALIKAQEDLKKKYAATYDQKVADGMDAMDLFASGTEEGLARAIKIRFADKYNIGDIVNKINAASDEDYNKLIQTSFIGSRKSALEDRSAYVDTVLKDTKNIKDLLIGETPTGLARFIGEPLGKGDEAAATARLSTALEGPSVQPAKPADAASLLGLEVGGKGAEIFDFNNVRHTSLANKAVSAFNKEYYNDSLKDFVFSYDKDKDKDEAAKVLLDGYPEAKAAGYKLGKIAYARDRYIEFALQNFGIKGYLNQTSTLDTAKQTALQPGTTEGTQTGIKVDETQTVVGAEDVGAISAKDPTARTGDKAKEAAEKTEKVSVPKSTVKVNIGTGDAAPDPSELNQNAPGLQLANDGMLYSRGKAVKMFAPLERELEEAQAIAFQVKVANSFRDDNGNLISDTEGERAKRLADLRQDFLQTIAGFGITQYTPEF
jgi:hypothetical protein